MPRTIGKGLVPLSSEKEPFTAKIDSDLIPLLKQLEEKARTFGVKFDRNAVVEDALREAIDVNERWFADQERKPKAV